MVVQHQKQKAQLSKMVKLKSVNLCQQKSVILAVAVAVLALVNDTALFRYARYIVLVGTRHCPLVST